MDRSPRPRPYITPLNHDSSAPWTQATNSPNGPRYGGASSSTTNAPNPNTAGCHCTSAYPTAASVTANTATTRVPNQELAESATRPNTTVNAKVAHTANPK